MTKTRHEEKNLQNYLLKKNTTIDHPRAKEKGKTEEKGNIQYYWEKQTENRNAQIGRKITCEGRAYQNQ